MPQSQDPGELAARAAEQLLGDAGLRDELTDDEAQPLLDWGLAQVKALAYATAAESAVDSSPEAAEEALKGIMRLLKRINRFVGLRAQGDPDALAVELDRLRAVSGKLYGERPGLLPDEDARYALLDEIAAMDTPDVIQHLLGVFGPAAENAAPVAETVLPDAESGSAPEAAIEPPLLPRHEVPPALSSPPQPAQLDAPPSLDRLAPPPRQEQLGAPPTPEKLAPPPPQERLDAPRLAGLLNFLGRDAADSDSPADDSESPAAPPDSLLHEG